MLQNDNEITSQTKFSNQNVQFSYPLHPALSNNLHFEFLDISKDGSLHMYSHLLIKLGSKMIRGGFVWYNKFPNGDLDMSQATLLWVELHHLVRVFHKNKDFDENIHSGIVWTHIGPVWNQAFTKYI